MMHCFLLAATIVAGTLGPAGASAPYHHAGISAARSVATHAVASMPHDRPIVKEAIVAAPVADVWAAWTTAEGTKTFFAPDARIETKVGGPYEILFMADAPAGQRGSEGSTILVLEPMKRLAFTWNAPPKFEKIRNGSHKTRVDVQLEPVDATHTKVTLTHSGWPHGDDWEELRTYFDNAWSAVLQSLTTRFTSGPVDWRAGK